MKILNNSKMFEGIHPLSSFKSPFLCSKDEKPHRDVSVPCIMLSSTFAGMLSRIPCHPLDTAKAQMQASTKRISFTQALVSSFRTNGIRGLYPGFGAAFIGSAPASCLYFTAYELSKKKIENSGFDSSSFMWLLAAGMIAETVSCIFWVPIDVVKERLQVQRVSLGSKQYYTGNLNALTRIFTEEGLRSVYKGYGATLLAYGPFSAIYLSTYENLKKFGAKSLGDDNPLVFFLSGGLAGGIASFITSPLDMVKLRIQVQRKALLSGEPSPFNYTYKHSFDGLSQVWRNDGLRGLYKGALARVTFAAPAAAVTISLFDSLKPILAKYI